MTRKDFEWFAEYVVDEHISEHGIGTLMRYFSKKNPRFDAIRFRDRVAILKKFREEAING